MTASAPLNLRQTARDAVRAEVRDRAMELFAQRGFDATTVDDIVSAVGISARSFFRYFPTKEDVALGDGERWGAQLVEALAQQPADTDPWQAMRNAMQSLIEDDKTEPERVLRDMRVIMNAPSLRSRNAEKHLQWARMLLPVAEQLLGGDRKTRRLRAQVLVHGSITCLDVAFAEWVAVDGATPLDDLLDAAFDALR